MSEHDIVALLSSVIVIGAIFGIIFLLEKRDQEIERKRKRALMPKPRIRIKVQQGRGRQRVLIAPQDPGKADPTRTLTQRFLSSLIVVSALFGLVLAGDWLYDQYDRLDPEIHPRDSDPSSSYILPFTIKNRSGRIRMTDVTLSCGVELVVFEDKEKKKYGVSDIILDSDISYPEISASSNDPINYKCDATPVLKAQKDGSVHLGGLATRPNMANPPLTVESMCVWIEAKYRSFGIERTYISPMFEWVATPTGHRWLEGRLVAAHKTEAVETCRARAEPPFMRLLPDGQIMLQLTY